MATGNMLLGLSRKKLGDLVFYRSEGQQRARVRVRKIKNPRTAKQAVQRMILSTAAKMAAAFKPIVDHSWQGVAVGVHSVRLFRSKAMAALRTAAIDGIEGDGTIVADFSLKGAPIVGMLEGLQISQGSLSVIPVGSLTENHLSFGGVVSYGEDGVSVANEAAYNDFLQNSFGCVGGDQLTLVAVSVDIHTPVAEFGTSKNFAQVVRYARMVFKTWSEVAPEGASLKVIDNGALNSVIYTTEGSLQLELTNNSRSALAIEKLTGVALAGIIRTHVSESGVYQYSTSRLVADRDVLDWNNANEAFASYMDGADEVSVGDTLYLRNAVASLA